MSIKIAIAGNPNCGKTTLFNLLTGSNQYVGNWPGVTVEKKEGQLKGYDDVIVTDLPGIYSLSPYTLEEVVARNYLINEKPDAILNIVDGTNIERNLYLTTQLTEIGIPVVIAINMMDVVSRRGDYLNTEQLGAELGCSIVEISALKGIGIDKAVELAIEAAKRGRQVPKHNFAGCVEHALAHIEEAAVHGMDEDRQRWYAVKIFERDTKVIEDLKLDATVINHIERDIKRVEHELDDDAESIIVNERYVYIGGVVSRCYRRKNKNGITTSDKIDKILTNRFLAIPIFAVIMWFVYFISIGSIGDFTVGFMNDTLFGEWIVPGVQNGLGSIGCAPWLISLIGDGIVGGVGAVLSFVPQMLILFLLLSLLEDCGYMARVAFILDKLFRKFGLSGKSFIPMLVATGCGVPGIMASRTIEQDRDRKMTVMTTGFIPCGAKMPIVGMIAGGLFGGSAWVAISAYFIGVMAVIISGLILKKTKPFAGNESPFVMELPAYHAPVIINTLRATWERGWSFIKRAGTVILAASIIIWVLNNISFSGGFHFITAQSGGASILEVVGSAMRWVFAPLGFDSWQASVATVLGLMAKEQVVSTFGTLASTTDYGVMTTAFLGTGLAGFSFMVFNLLCAPCFAAMGAIKREMNNWKWTAATIGYMCTFAYGVSLMIYQFGAWFIGKGSIIGTAAALVVLAVMLYLIFRKDKNKTVKKAESSVEMQNNLVHK